MGSAAGSTPNNSKYSSTRFMIVAVDLVCAISILQGFEALRKIGVSHDEWAGTAAVHHSPCGLARRVRADAERYKQRLRPKVSEWEKTNENNIHTYTLIHHQCWGCNKTRSTMYPI